MNRLRLAIALALLISLPVHPAWARVFHRWSASARSDRALESVGGEVAYQSAVTINGAHANLTLFSFRLPIADVFRTLRNTFSLSETSFQGGTLGYATVRDGGSVLRLIVFRLTTEDRTLLFKVEQSEAEYAASKEPPEILVRDLPVFPNVRPVFSADTEAADMSIGIGQAAAQPTAVRRFYDSALKGDRWTTALPDKAPPEGAGMTVYLRDNQVCCVLAEESDDALGTRITLLHKRLRLE